MPTNKGLDHEAQCNPGKHRSSCYFVRGYPRRGRRGGRSSTVNDTHRAACSADTRTRMAGTSRACRGILFMPADGHRSTGLPGVCGLKRDPDSSSTDDKMISDDTCARTWWNLSQAAELARLRDENADWAQVLRGPVSWLGCFEDEIGVLCRSCGGRATVVADPRFTAPGQRRLHRLATCRGCGHSETWSARRRNGAWVTPGLPVSLDPFFGLPLWLRGRCCEDRIGWAYNEQHLDLLRAYLSRPHQKNVTPDADEHRAPMLSLIDRFRTEIVRFT